MTSYHGGKQKIGKTLSSIIYDISTKVEKKTEVPIVGYCEPFCGMLGVFRHIPSLFGNIKYLAGDINESVIKMWKKSQKGWVPPTHCTEKTFENLKYNHKSSAEKGFIGHQYSYGGKYFIGYKNKYMRNKRNSKAASKRVQEISKEVKDVKFKYGPYTQFSNLEGYVIYCDPPYEGAQNVYEGEGFDNSRFWEWCKMMARKNIVFVSEYRKVKGTIILFRKKVKVKIANNSNASVNREEKLLFVK